MFTYQVTSRAVTLQRNVFSAREVYRRVSMKPFPSTSSSSHCFTTLLTPTPKTLTTTTTTATTTTTTLISKNSLSQNTLLSYTPSRTFLLLRPLPLSFQRTSSRRTLCTTSKQQAEETKEKKEEVIVEAAEEDYGAPPHTPVGQSFGMMLIFLIAVGALSWNMTNSLNRNSVPFKLSWVKLGESPEVKDALGSLQVPWNVWSKRRWKEWSKAEITYTTIGNYGRGTVHAGFQMHDKRVPEITWMEVHVENGLRKGDVIEVIPKQK